MRNMIKQVAIISKNAMDSPPNMTVKLTRPRIFETIMAENMLTQPITQTTTLILSPSEVKNTYILSNKQNTHTVMSKRSSFSMAGHVISHPTRKARARQIRGRSAVDPRKAENLHEIVTEAMPS